MLIKDLEIKLNEFETKKNNIIEHLQLELRKFSEQFFRDLFKEFPDIQFIAWQQWIPSFNDGDPCEFTVGWPIISTKIPLEEYEKDIDNSLTIGEASLIYNIDLDNIPYFDKKSDSEYKINVYLWNEDTFVDEKGSKISETISNIFSKLESYLQAAFGNNAQVVAFKSGNEIKFKVDEYDCGY